MMRSAPFHPALRALAPLAAGLVASACWVPIEQGQAMEADIVKVKSELSAQRRATDELDTRAKTDREKLKSEMDRLKADQEAAMRRVDAKVREVGDALDNLNRTARKTGADLGVEMEEAQAEMARLRGQVEETQARLVAIEQAISQLRADSEAKLAAAADRVRQLEDERRKAAEAALKAAEEAKKAAARPANKDDFYKLAHDKLDQGDVEAARQLFVEFLQRWKEDGLAPNAQYWLGETYYAEKRYREAIFEFQKVRDSWPRNEKAADALLKIALSFEGLALADDARVFYDDLVRSYPKSMAAGKARERLEQLARPGGAKAPDAKDGKRK